MNQLICKAISNRNVIVFYYKNEEKRIVEPYCYGVYKDTSNEVLCAYQIGGYSESKAEPPWRLYLIEKMEKLTISEKTFCSVRFGYNPDDSRMSEIYCRV